MSAAHTDNYYFIVSYPGTHHSWDTDEAIRAFMKERGYHDVGSSYGFGKRDLEFSHSLAPTTDVLLRLQIEIMGKFDLPEVDVRS